MALSDLHLSSHILESADCPAMSADGPIMSSDCPTMFANCPVMPAVLLVQRAVPQAMLVAVCSAASAVIGLLTLDSQPDTASVACNLWMRSSLADKHTPALTLLYPPQSQPLSHRSGLLPQEAPVIIDEKLKLMFPAQLKMD